MNVLSSVDTKKAEAAEIVDELWYKDAIIYQLHVKAFADSNNDGIGDFAGLTEKLGVRSSWNGQRPTRRAPCFLSDVRSSTTATRSAAAFTASTEVSLIRATRGAQRTTARSGRSSPR